MKGGSGRWEEGGRQEDMERGRDGRTEVRREVRGGQSYFKK